MATAPPSTLQGRHSLRSGPLPARNPIYQQQDLPELGRNVHPPPPQGTTSNAGPQPFQPLPPRSQQPPNRETQMWLVITQLLHYVPQSEPYLHPLLNLIQDPQLIQNLINTLNGPLTDWQAQKLVATFSNSEFMNEEFMHILRTPNHVFIPAILAQLSRDIQAISSPPVPPQMPENPPDPSSGRTSRPDRAPPRQGRRPRRSESRDSDASSEPSVLGPAHPYTGPFPIDDLRESRFKLSIVQDFS
ncbi:hypothetical protein C0991_011672, partial [Blastosporella zonata]